jgi:hypothetical protein
VRAKPRGIRGNAEGKVDMQAKCTEAAARDAMEHVVQLGVPAPHKIVALSKWYEVLRGA